MLNYLPDAIVKMSVALPRNAALTHVFIFPVNSLARDMPGKEGPLWHDTIVRNLFIWRQNLSLRLSTMRTYALQPERVKRGLVRGECGCLLMLLDVL